MCIRDRVKAGQATTAELSWMREDGLTDTELGGVGTITGLSEGEKVYLEEGVEVSFHDTGEGSTSRRVT